MDRFMRTSLDRYITGNYGEDSVPEEQATWELIEEFNNATHRGLSGYVGESESFSLSEHLVDLYLKLLQLSPSDAMILLAKEFNIGQIS